VRALTADDVADCIMFAVTAPEHMVVDELLVLSIDQSNGFRIHRAEG
jgi:NADP-dependent 3-hydroxy acid dehydrogenase YdfG